MRYSARWQEHGCAGLSSFEVYTSGASEPTAADREIVLRLLFSSPKHRYDRRSCCSISIARARRALTQHTHRRAPLGTRLNLSYAAAGRARVQTSAMGDYGTTRFVWPSSVWRRTLLPCQHSNRCTLHWSKWLIPCRRCLRHIMSSHDEHNQALTSPLVQCMPCVTSSTVVTCEVQMQTISP